MRLDPTFGDLKELRAQMLRWARKMVRGGNQAEDLVQTALLKMIAARSRAPQRQEEIAPWAFVVLRNVWRSETVAESRRGILVPLDAAALRAPDDPFTAVYCRQVCALLGFDAAALLAEPRERPLSGAERIQLHRARSRVLQVAA